MRNLVTFGFFVGAFFTTLGSTAGAAAYGDREVAYITSSQDYDEIAYIVCLEEAVGKTPRNMDMFRALNRSARTCKNAGFHLKRRGLENNIRDFVWDCGFRLEDANRGKVGSLSARVPAPPIKPRCTPPEQFISGRCRIPVGTQQRCAPPEEFISGRCRIPASAQRCTPPLKFVGGRCR